MRIPPLNTSNSQSTNYASINNALRQINNEQTTKAFKGPNGNTVVSGKLPYDGGYGILIYDGNGIPLIVMGVLPDGSSGLVIAKDGVSVLDVFS